DAGDQRGVQQERDIEQVRDYLQEELRFVLLEIDVEQPPDRLRPLDDLVVRRLLGLILVLFLLVFLVVGLPLVLRGVIGALLVGVVAGVNGGPGRRRQGETGREDEGGQKHEPGGEGYGHRALLWRFWVSDAA